MNMKNKYFWTALLLAILCGILAGACHALSVAKHRTNAQIDTFNELVVNVPTPSVEAEFKAITKPEPVFAKDEVDVVRKHDDGIPEEVKASAEKWGEVYNICPELIEALAYQESRFKADVVSADGMHIGLCQINPNCHSKRMKRLGVTDLKDIDGNIAVACDYLAELFMEYEGDPDIALMCYNGDYSWRSGHISRYANEILERSAELERLHGK
jgi:soluble lytic murein transglycosylase-like protein